MENKSEYIHNQQQQHNQYQQQTNEFQHQQFEHQKVPPPSYTPQTCSLPPQAYEQQVHHAPIIVTQQCSTIIVGPHLGPDPTRVECPSCRNSVVTRMDYETTTKTHIWAAVLCIFGLWPCACIPYCIDSCKNGNHYCPNCGSFIGTYKTF